MPGPIRNWYTTVTTRRRSGPTPRGAAMATGHHSREKPTKQPRDVPPLENGDRLDQKTFHERYEAMPAGVRAQLIGGVVYMSSPQKTPHGRVQATFVWWLGEYTVATDGTDLLVGSTSVLNGES